MDYAKVSIDVEQAELYWNTIIPNIKQELLDESKSNAEKLELYNLYTEVLRWTAQHNFMAFNEYLELDEDHGNPNKAFYYHRKNHIGEIFEAMNDMEIYDKYDLLLVSTPPRVGKTTTGIRFLAWITGRHPENTQLGISYSDSITTSFYIGVMEIVTSERFIQVFPECNVVNQNAKREEIWLKVMKRYPSILFVPIGGSMTGRAEAGNYLYCDDLVSGIEEALSITRLESLWSKYTVNAKQRKKDNAKEIHIATKWSVHDPITRLARENEDNPRCKIIAIPCYGEDGESQLDFFGGFSTAYYKELERTMDSLSFGALYLCDPIEREGLLYPEDTLQYYMRMPDERPDSVISICDSKNLGKDFVCAPIAYCMNDLYYIEDVVYNNGLPEITRPLVANKWMEHNVVRADVELNNGGNYYAEDLEQLLKDGGGKTSIRIFFSSNNKTTKIITYSDFVKKHFVFRHPSTYHPQSDYAKFMKSLTSWTQTGDNKHDDAPDAVAMLAQLIQDISYNQIKIIDRRTLKL